MSEAFTEPGDGAMTLGWGVGWGCSGTRQVAWRTDGKEWHFFADIDGTNSLTGGRGGSGFTGLC